MKDITTEYFNWLYDIIADENKDYRKLCEILHSINYSYGNMYDANRYENGVYMRYRFAQEKGYDHEEPMIASTIDNRDCSMFEMMVALAWHIETDIMANSEEGNRTYLWFEVMLNSLHIDVYEGDSAETNAIDILKAVQLFLNKGYSSNGDGGLFYIPDTNKDLREMEIWYQANEYLIKYY